MRPMSNKGRMFNSKLEEEDVRAIRVGVASGEPMRLVASRFGVALDTVRKIVRRDTFAWVADDEQQMQYAQANPYQKEVQDEIAASLERLQRKLAEKGE